MLKRGGGERQQTRGSAAPSGGPGRHRGAAPALLLGLLGAVAAALPATPPLRRRGLRAAADGQ